MSRPPTSGRISRRAPSARRCSRPPTRPWRWCRPGPNQDAIAAKRAEWAKTLSRWESEPATGEGRKELTAKARASEDRRDLSLLRYHHYELASAAFQIGIVLASAEVITGIAVLVFAGGFLGLAGAALLGFGYLAPHALPFFH